MSVLDNDSNDIETHDVEVVHVYDSAWQAQCSCGWKARPWFERRNALRSGVGHQAREDPWGDHS